MPISRDEFDRFDPTEDEPTNAERVVRFLAEHRDQAFRASEIAAATDVDSNSIHPVLTRLKDRNLVRHKEPYWAIGDLDRVHDAYMLHRTNQFLNETLGPENADEWLEAGGDSE